MPSMYEIYEKHSCEYDELVSREDYQGNLKALLTEDGLFSGKSVIEFGCGTGRVTSMYAAQASLVRCYDRSAHMIGAAESNLAAFSDRIRFGICDNREIGSLDGKADIIIEGWSFGHTVDDSADRVAETDRLCRDCMNLLNPGGMLIFIESLGTNYAEPGAPTPALDAFFSRLESRHGFERTVLSTDYRFETNEEALRIAGFFFGEEFRRNLSFDEPGIIKEYTGVWVRR